MGFDDATVILATRDKNNIIYRVFWSGAGGSKYRSENYVIKNKNIIISKKYKYDKLTAFELAYKIDRTEYGVVYISHDIDIDNY